MLRTGKKSHNLESNAIKRWAATPLPPPASSQPKAERHHRPVQLYAAVIIAARQDFLRLSQPKAERRHRPVQLYAAVAIAARQDFLRLASHDMAGSQHCSEAATWATTSKDRVLQDWSGLLTVV